jgi:hypothetical protein
MPADPTPASVVNPPGRDALRYRIGTFTTFRQAMLDIITIDPVMNPSPIDPATVFTLTSRASDDYGVAFLELWAYVCDVLTFYQQTIANEAYLRTATQFQSVVRLAALLGYKPAPSVAASVLVAFNTAKNATAEIPAGLQVQSVPPPGKKPVIYEVANALLATARNNQPIMLGKQIPLPLENSGILLVDDPAQSIAAGARLIFFDSESGFMSEQQVTSVTPQPMGKLVTWRGQMDPDALNPDSFTCHRLGRTFRLFGSNAPQQYLAPKSSDPTQFEMRTTPTELASGTPGTSPFWLDNVYTGLGVGSQVLVRFNWRNEWSFRQAEITSVVTGSVTAGPLTGNSTGITVSWDMENLSLTDEDGRDITIYELGSPLLFSPTGFDADSSPSYDVGEQTINVVDASEMAAGTQIVLASSDESGRFGDTAILAESPTPIRVGPVIIGHSLRLDRALTHAYTAASTTIFANVVAATQGATQANEIVGSGDATVAWQEFALKGKPVTYVANPAAERGAATTLQIFVDGIEWQETKTFYGCSPTARVFTTRVAPDGKWFVRFGDGLTGARPTTGSRNVTAMYRAGAGSDGNADAGAISIIVQAKPGLQSVSNPLPAVGGGDGEPLARLRENAPVSVLTLGRAVSLRDYEALALTYRDGSIAKARASWTDFNDRRGVTLTACTVGGLPLGELAQPLRDFLDAHRDPNVPLSIVNATEVFIALRATIHVQSGHLLSVVKPAVDAALGLTGDVGYLSFARVQIGQSVYQSRVLAAMQDVAGVEWVELHELSTPFSSGALGFAPMNRFPHLLIHPIHRLARRTLDAVYINPQQIARLSLTGHPTDIGAELTFSGGVNDLP